MVFREDGDRLDASWFMTVRAARAVVAAVVAAGLLLGGAHGARAASAEPNALGMNLDSQQDWIPQRMFADAMKSSRTLKRLGSKSPAAEDVAMDAARWPTEDFEIGFWFDAERMDGTYRLYFKGKADVDAVGATVQKLAYDGKTNTSTAAVVVTEAGPGALVLRFAHTRRAPRSTAADGLTDVKLMRPLAEGSTRSHPPDAFLTTQFVRALAPFSVLRYNGFQSGDYGEVVDWADRALPGPSLNRPMPSCDPRDSCWSGQGGPWEYVILVANALHKDAWISIPLHVSDDYLRQLALLLRDGNAFTGRRGLDRSLHLYVELSNELWNWGYLHTTENSDAAKKEYQNGDPYHYGPEDPKFNPWRLRPGRRTADISRIFRSVFGDAAMMTRVRPVLAWQSVNIDTGLEALVYLEDNYIPACVAGQLPAIAGVARCRAGTKVSDLVYAGGGSAYYYTDDDHDRVTLDNIWTSLHMNAAVWGQSHQIANTQLARAFGLKRVAYEGGPHFHLFVSQDDKGQRFTPQHPGCPSDVARMAAWSDPRMKQAVLDHHAAWSQWDGDLLVYSGFTGDNRFAFIHDVLDVDAPDMNKVSPKMAALRQLAGGARPPVTLGAPVPATVDGNAYDLGYRSWYRRGTGKGRVPKGEWLSYLFNVPTDARYQITVDTSDASARHATLLVDGAPFPAPATDHALTATVELRRGLHAVRVKAPTTDVTVNTVSIKR
jgi:hypothetical protein